MSTEVALSCSVIDPTISAAFARSAAVTLIPVGVVPPDVRAAEVVAPAVGAEEAELDGGVLEPTVEDMAVGDETDVLPADVELGTVIPVEIPVPSCAPVDAVGGVVADVGVGALALSPADLDGVPVAPTEHAVIASNAVIDSRPAARVRECLSMARSPAASPMSPPEDRRPRPAPDT
jgi:hypothetical protein